MSKSEARNLKQVQIHKIEMAKTKRFGNLNFGFVSSFDIRIPDLEETLLPFVIRIVDSILLRSWSPEGLAYPLAAE